MNQRQAAKARTRQQIVEAAAAEFAEHGYDGTSFASVAAAMNRPKSAVGYHLFPSKLDLAAAVVEQQQARWLEMEARTTEPAGLANLVTMLLSACLDALRCPVAAGAIRLSQELGEAGQPLPRAFSWRSYTLEHFAVARGLSADDPEAARAADLVVSSTFGVLRTRAHSRTVEATEQQLRDLWAALFTGLGIADAGEVVRGVVPVTVADPVDPAIGRTVDDSIEDA
jgi:AcrR family transcriptional regulator